MTSDTCLYWAGYYPTEGGSRVCCPLSWRGQGKVLHSSRRAFACQAIDLRLVKGVSDRDAILPKDGIFVKSSNVPSKGTWQAIGSWQFLVTSP